VWGEMWGVWGEMWGGRVQRPTLCGGICAHVGGKMHICVCIFWGVLGGEKPPRGGLKYGFLQNTPEGGVGDSNHIGYLTELFSNKRKKTRLRKLVPLRGRGGGFGGGLGGGSWGGFRTCA
jgi:hypothetical protein